MTQCEKILRYMEKFGRITQRDAVHLGCYRLSARIKDLRDEGYIINTEYRQVVNADGSRSNIGVYSLGRKS